MNKLLLLYYLMISVSVFSQELISNIAHPRSINIISEIVVSGITESGFSLNWVTDFEGTTEAQYGKTPGFELGCISNTELTEVHSLHISGKNRAEIFFVRPFSVKNDDTITAETGIYITGSGSSGIIKVYFNRTVDESVTSNDKAIQLYHSIDDTLISYISRAKESIDLAIYSFNNSGIVNISDALNEACRRGVRIRVVYDGNNKNPGIKDLLPEIGRIASPESNPSMYGIMHNKFVVFDAEHQNPDVPVVWTGSANFTSRQINTDANNVIIIQDQSLAKAFLLEFNEMFGSTGIYPDPEKSRFGPKKTNNTPHTFLIGGKTVECYFSPTDSTNKMILKIIDSAEYSLYIATMVLTRPDLCEAICNRKQSGNEVKIILNEIDRNIDPALQCSRLLLKNLNYNFLTATETGIMHHKYMITDVFHPEGDPAVLTGSHNWSSNADERNDENTLIIHSELLAEQYFQEFMSRFKSNQITGVKPICEDDFYTLKRSESVNYSVLDNDYIPLPVILSISRKPESGKAEVFNSTGIYYQPDERIKNESDTIIYRVCLISDNTACSEAKFIIDRCELSSGQKQTIVEDFSIRYINKGTVQLNSSVSIFKLELFDLNGKCIYSEFPFQNEVKFRKPLHSGFYILRIQSESGKYLNEKIFL